MTPSVSPASAETAEPLLELIEALAAEDLHAAAWERCMQPGWMFGHASNGGAGGRFWHLDLNTEPTFDRIWALARPHCEALAGRPLRVVRQYANGHTYGLGGAAHRDDERPGTFTLLWYPNPEWRPEWEGETVWYDAAGDIGFVVQPRPNRAVFFDSRIPHNGRAPARSCPALRVTVAWKLESAPIGPAERPASPVAPPSRLQEIVREVDEACLTPLAAQRLASLGAHVRLPGQGGGPPSETALRARYGERARLEALSDLADRIVLTELIPEGFVPAECKLALRPSGGEVRVAATALAELPPVDPAAWRFTRLSGPTDVETAAERVLRTAVLDRLESLLDAPVLPALVNREIGVLVGQAQARGLSPEDLGASSWEDALAGVALRRLKIGFVAAELARRFGIAGTDETREAAVVDHILALATIETRAATDAELSQLRG